MLRSLLTRVALLSSVAALSTWAAACARLPPGPAVVAPAPPRPSAAASAAPVEAGVRFPALTWGEEEVRGYQLSSRRALRLTDLASGQLSEHVTSSWRVEQTRSLPSGGLETAVVSDGELVGDRRLDRPSYTVTTKGTDVDVQVKRGEVLAPDYEKDVVTRARLPSALSLVSAFLTERAFARGEAVPLPASVLGLLDEAERGTATLEAVEERWQRQVARFALVVTREATADRPELRGEGALYVELETGRPIALRSTLRKTRTWTEKGREVRGSSVEVHARRWGVNRKDQHVGASFSAEPEPSVVGSPLDLVLAPNDRDAAVLLDRPAGREITVWDLGRRQPRASWGTTARFVAFDHVKGVRVLYEIGDHAVESRVLVGDLATPFGGVMLMDMTFVPSAVASSAHWVAVGSTDGRVTLAEPRNKCIVGAFPTRLKDVRAMALTSHPRLEGEPGAGREPPPELALVDARGEVEVLELRVDTGNVKATPACSLRYRGASKAHFKLPVTPTPVTRLDALDGTLLFTAPTGEVFASTTHGPARALGRLGAEATLTRGANGVAVTTRQGTTPLGAPARDKKRVAQPKPERRESAAAALAPAAPLDGKLALGRSGALGVRTTGAFVSLFEPGRPEGARTGSLATPVFGAFAHGARLVAVSPEQSIAWDLRTASARAASLRGPTSPAGASPPVSSASQLAATVDGARYALVTRDGLEVRDTDTGAVVRAWRPAELPAAVAAPSGARLGRGGATVALRGADGGITWLDVPTGKPAGSLPPGAAAGLASFALSPTEDLLVSLRSDGQLIGTDLATGRPRFSVKATSAVAGREVVAFSPDGAWVAVTGTHREGSGWNPSIPVVELRGTQDGKLVVSLSPTWAPLTSALVFSPDKKLLFAGTREGRLLTWDTASGVLVNEHLAHERAIEGLSFASGVGGGGWLVSASGDGSVRLWEPRTMEEFATGGALGVFEEAIAPRRSTKLVATLMVDARGDAIAATGDGYYKADRGSLRVLRLGAGLERYEFQQFDALLHRPDLVVDRLGVGDREQLALFRAAHAKREELLRGKVPRKLPEPPKVTFERPLPLLTRARRLGLQLRVEAGQSEPRELRALHVTVDSVPVGPIGGVPLSGATWTGEIPLVLGAGANRVEVYAIDSRGAASTIASHVVEYTGPTEPPSLHVVVVGVSKYANPRFNLDYAAKDARDVGALLGASKRFAKVNVLEILDERATRSGILSARAFLEKAQVDDTVVVFLAGHGVLDKNLDYWFATTDIDPKDPAKSALGYEQLGALVTGLTARRRLVLLDTCHAGEADKTGEPTWTPPALAQPATPRVKQFRGLELVRVVPKGQSFGLMQQLFTDLRAGSGAIVLGSAGGAELALESSAYKNGVFTFALLEALKEGLADANRSGDVSVTELTRYVSGRVEALTNGAQRPATRGENLDLDFPIY